MDAKSEALVHSVQELNLLIEDTEEAEETEESEEQEETSVR